MRVIAKPPRRGGFTLVELLVVLGILVLLLSILLPAVGLARQSAHQVQCAANLRQWGQAVTMYATQNNSFLPRRGQGVQVTTQINRPTDWFNALPPILNMPSYAALAGNGTISRPGSANSIWLCPSASDLPGTNYWSYGMNMGLSVWDTSINAGNPDQITQVGDPTVMVFLTDAPGNYCSVFPSAPAGGYNPAARHRSSINICFLDGHVSAVSGASIGCGKGLIQTPDVQWHPPGNTWVP